MVLIYQITVDTLQTLLKPLDFYMPIPNNIYYNLIRVFKVTIYNMLEPVGIIMILIPNLIRVLYWIYIFMHIVIIYLYSN